MVRTLHFRSGFTANRVILALPVIAAPTALLALVGAGPTSAATGSYSGEVAMQVNCSMQTPATSTPAIQKTRVMSTSVSPWLPAPAHLSLSPGAFILRHRVRQFLTPPLA